MRLVEKKEKKQKQPEIEWDKGKLFLVLILIVGIIIAAIVYQKLNSANDASGLTSQGNKFVKGASTTNLPVYDFKRNVQNQINNLRNEAQSINLVEIASSSPQVQKVINDLKGIKEYPGNQLKQTCERICSGL